MASVDPAPGGIPPSSPAEMPRLVSAPPRVVVVVALALLLGFIAVQGRALWLEWGRLRGELAVVRRTTVVGYPNITPNPSYAQRPPDWFHDEGEATLLWSGWQDGAGHRWFRVGRGEVDRRRLSLPFGRDVVQAIDYPLVEAEGGSIWGRIPAEAPVVGQELGGVFCVYPLQMLDKVEVVNDRVGSRPFLVVYDPSSRDLPVEIYEPVLGGQRVTMGLSGYFHDGQPLLYDRGTESLWVHASKGLVAIAGVHKGAQLPRLGRPTPISWGDWRSRHPESRLVVGADRTRSRPAL